MRSPSLLRGTRGSSLVEHILAIGLVALAALAAWTLLGEREARSVDCAARAITGAANVPCRAPGRSSLSLASPPARPHSLALTSTPTPTSPSPSTSTSPSPSTSTRSASTSAALTRTPTQTPTPTPALWTAPAATLPFGDTYDVCDPLCQMNRAASFTTLVAAGIGDAAWATLTGLAMIASTLVTDPIGSGRAIAGAVRDPSLLWRGTKLIGASMWAEIVAAAHGDPEAIGRVTFDVGTLVVPASKLAIVPARVARAARLARVARALRPAAAAAATSADARGILAATFRSPAERAEAARYWREPHHAFGSSANEIQYSWELENAIGASIFRTHRPASIAESDWAAMTFDERLAHHGEHLQSWKSYVPRDEPEVADGLSIFDFYHPRTIGDRNWSRLSERAKVAHHLRYDAPKDGILYVRRASAPSWMRPRLKRIGSASYETTTYRYAQTLEELFDQTGFLREALPGGGYHWHATFVLDPAYGNEIADVLGVLNEQATLQQIAGSWTRVHHRVLGPMGDDVLANVRTQIAREGELRGRRATREEIREIRQPAGYQYKPYAVGFRGRIYRDPNRYGLELRWSNSDIADSARTLDTMTRFLESPRTATLRLGDRSPGFRAADAAGIDRLGPATVDRFAPDVRRFLEHIDVDYPVKKLDGRPIVRWATPLVRWEERAWLPAGVRRAVVAERARFEAALSRAARRFEAGEHAAYQEIVERAVSDWAARTELWRYL